AQVLREVTVITPHHCGAGRLIALHHFAVLFGVKLLRQPGRAHQITEHHRELPPLGLGCSEASSELWGLGLRWGVLARGLSRGGCGCRLRQRRAALTTELGAPLVLGPAREAASCQRGATLIAELGSFRILKPTARAAHAASLLLRAPQGKEKARLARFDNRRLGAR